jgi:hypothetical protein
MLVPRASMESRADAPLGRILCIDGVPGAWFGVARLANRPRVG